MNLKQLVTAFSIGTLVVTALIMGLTGCPGSQPGTIPTNQVRLITGSSAMDASLETQLSVAPSFKLASGGNLTVAPSSLTEHGVTFSRGDDSWVFNPNQGYIYSDPAVSADGRVAFFIVRKFRVVTSDGKVKAVGMNHDGLATFEIPQSPVPLSSTRHHLLLQKQELSSLLAGRTAWVSGIRQVSPDGDRLLLDVALEGIPGADYTPITRGLFWYWRRENRLIESVDRGDGP